MEAQEARVCQTTLAGSMIASFTGRATLLGQKLVKCQGADGGYPGLPLVEYGSHSPFSIEAPDMVCGHQVEMTTIGPITSSGEENETPIDNVGIWASSSTLSPSYSNRPVGAAEKKIRWDSYRNPGCLL